MARPRILLITPPLTQLNTPYPATAYLTGFLRSRGYEADQADLGLDMILRLFSRSGLEQAFQRIRQAERPWPGEVQQLLALEDAYLATIEPVIAFLQGKDPMLAPHLARPGFLPEGPRFSTDHRPVEAMHTCSPADAARHRATLYIEDLTDLLHETIAPHLLLNRYAEHIMQSTSSFDRIEEALSQPLSLTDELLLDALKPSLARTTPDVVGLTVPFPGNLFGALRLAQAIKTQQPTTKIVLGGGYVNTELRRLQDPRVFQYVDYVTLDDGERPLLCLLDFLTGKLPLSKLCRTFSLVEGRVSFHDGNSEPDVPMHELGTPTYAGLPLGDYLSILDSLNPMHRLWSEGHWNKLTVAHGCYWKQCTFCDVGLNYIARYEMTPTDLLIRQIDRLVQETGQRGFHFVDEAAPPAALKALALRLLETGRTISWWGNIRFEETFSPDLARLLAASGCIALTAGLEAASDRLLEQMKKGITVDQTARVASAFHQAGILVHAYLMYGCPGETIADTVDSLERVRQLFAGNLLQSAFWHRFTATAHSPIGLNPAANGLMILGPAFAGFAENDLRHADSHATCPPWLGEGLRTAVLNYIEQAGLDLPVQRWFSHRVKPPRVARTWLTQALAEVDAPPLTAERRCVWIGGKPVVLPRGTRQATIILPTRTEDVSLQLAPAQAEWLLTLLRDSTPSSSPPNHAYPRLAEVRSSFRGAGARAFERFAETDAWRRVKQAGLLLV
ncbi:MAG: radical SAM protein [Nitrospira sp.]|nr:radical SAM protein [Nitrospira sp.]